MAKGLRWDAINWNGGDLRVPAAIAKTGRKRKIILSENLLEWLTPYRGRTVAIFAKDFPQAHWRERASGQT